MGRGGQLAVFRENLGLPPAAKAYIFTVYGEGGVGKSTLLEQWRQIARAAGATEALVDERVFSAPEAMSALLDQLGQPREAKDFRARYASFRKNRDRLESDPQAPSELWSKIVRTGVKAGLHASKAIPGAGPVVDLVDGDTAADAVDRVRQFLATKVRDSREVRLMLYPTEELGPLFADALRRIATSRSIVLFFDTFEQSGVVLEDWLIDLMSGEHGEIPATVTLVIAGRLPLDINRWADLLGLIAPVPLAVFTAVEIRQLLAAHEVTDSRAVDMIMSLSGGLPLLVDMLAKSRPAGADEVDDPADTAVERFLKWEPDVSRRQAALAGALPRRIDEDLLGAALGREDAADLFGWLIHQAFIRGDRYHDVVRAPMLRWQRQRSPQRWREAHARLAAAHRERRDSTDTTPWEAENWQAHQLEAVYHGLCSRELPLDAVLADAAEVVKAGISVARRWAEVIVEAGRDIDDPETQEVGRSLFEAATHGEDPATKLLTRLIDLGRHNSAGQAVLLLERGRLRYLADLDELAIEDCTRALRHDPDLAAAYAVRGAARGYLDRYDDALTDFGHALRLDPLDSWALARRGQAYSWMKRYGEAIDDLNRAIELNGTRSWAIGQRAETYRLMGRYDDAVVDFDRAIELERPSDAWTVGSRGQTFLAMGRYDEAIADFTRAIELDSGIAWLFGGRGLAHRFQDHFEQALSDFSRAITIKDSYSGAVAQRAETYRLMDRHAEALTDFDRAIALDRDYAWAIGHRGECYRQLSRYTEALADLDRAIALDGRDSWALASRGSVHRLTKQYVQAVTDLTAAIELDDGDDAWALAERGSTYRVMDRLDEAVADLTRAVELNDANAWASAELGAAYRERKSFDEALVRLNRAIDIDHDYAWAFAQRGETYRLLDRHRDALDDFDRAVQLGEVDSWTIGSRGQTHAALRNFDEALRDLNHAIELTDANDWALAERADVYRRMGNYERALEDVERVFALDDEDATYHVLRGVLRQELGQVEEAEADFRRATELDPSLSWRVVDGAIVFDDGRVVDGVVVFDD